jgi:hypothetical protein
MQSVLQPSTRDNVSHRSPVKVTMKDMLKHSSGEFVCN